MNQEQIAQINEAIALIEKAQNLSDSVKDDLQAEYDEWGEKKQDGEAGEKQMATIDMLEEIDFDGLISSLTDARNA